MHVILVWLCFFTPLLVDTFREAAAELMKTSNLFDVKLLLLHFPELTTIDDVITALGQVLKVLRFATEDFGGTAIEMKKACCPLQFAFRLGGPGSCGIWPATLSSREWLRQPPVH